MTQKMKLSDLVAETYTPDESKWVVFCDGGNGCSFGDAGRGVDYDAATHGELIMTPTMPHMSDDHIECAWASDWQIGENGFRWQVRF